MVTPLVTETLNRRSQALRDEVAQDEARALSRAMFFHVGGRDPLEDVTFDLEAVLREHHDYPSDDLWDALDMRATA